MRSLFVNPQTRLVGTSPNCANTSASSTKLQMEDFGKDNLARLASLVEFKAGVQ